METLMRRLATLAAFLMAGVAFAAPSAEGGASAGRDPASRVILLANRNNPESVELARYYAARRGIPPANLYTYPMSSDETISWPEFASSIWNPLMKDLVHAGWIDAIPMDVEDSAGRRDYSVNGDRIAYLVIFRGVPLRVADDPAIRDTPFPLSIAKQSAFQTDCCSVDSELTLLSRTLHPIVSFVPNPLFHNVGRTGLGDNRVVKVCRIDGPSLSDAEHLIDDGIEVERRGLIGRAYVDNDGPYAAGNAWFDKTAEELRRLGFDLDVDRKPTTLPITARFDAPALYFGWYAGDVDGPFLLPGAQLARGAIAYHLHSFSASTLRDPGRGWCGPLVARGAAATLGNVYEPLLLLTQRPDFFLEALERNWTLGDAAYYATPALSWQEVVIGDPLYRPFERSLDEQWTDRAALGARRAGYVVLREMNLLDVSGRHRDAIRMGESELAVRPSLALAYGLAQRLASAGDAAGARRVLSFVKSAPLTRAQDWAVVRDCARLLEGNGGADSAVVLYGRLLGLHDLPAVEKSSLLAEAVKAADAAGAHDEAESWKRDLARLQPAG